MAEQPKDDIPEDEYEHVENPQEVWNEERTNLNSRYLQNNKDNWRDGKDIHQQLESIINNNQMQFRLLDCCANCPLTTAVTCVPALFGFFCMGNPLWAPWTCGLGCCALYGCAESQANMNNGFLAAMKCALGAPFLSCLWMPPSVKTVLREAQEVPGTPVGDFAANFCCCACTSCQLFYNAYYMDKSWLPEEFITKDGLQLQMMHDPKEEKVCLD